jgi:alpha-glucosidase
LFTPITQLHYQRKSGRELIWSAGEGTLSECLITGTLLGSEVIRVRAVRGTGTQVDELRYQLADGGAGTLPYHSWVVAKGDEEWPDFASEDEARTMIEPYLQGFALSATQIRLTRPLESEERIYGLGERTGPMNKRGLAFPVWNIDPPMFHIPETVTMYTSIPFYVGLHMDDGRVYGVLIDFTGAVEMDMVQANELEATLTVEGDGMVAYFFVGQLEARRLDESRLHATEHLIDARLCLGHHAQILVDLSLLAAQHPMNENLHAKLMLALYRSGRRCRALQVYSELRAVLISELGLEPCPPVQFLHHAILSSDPRLDSPGWELFSASANAPGSGAARIVSAVP